MRIVVIRDQLTDTQLGPDADESYRRYREAEEQALLESLAWRKRRARLAERLERERIA